MRNTLITRGLALIMLLVGSAYISFGAARGPLQVGAARVDITPAPDANLPMGGYAGRKSGFQRIHDHIYTRAIVLGDGKSYAALLGIELVGVPTPVWEEMAQRITKETGIPADNILLAAVHDHSAPILGGMGGRNGAPPSPAVLAYREKVEIAVVDAVRQAKGKMRAAQFGFGAGKAYVNINRREFFPKSGWWWLGYNPDGPSDKTVAVLKFSDLSGKPIAMLINYAVHAVIMNQDNLAVTGDLAGATSRWVEQYYQGKLATRVDAGWDSQLRPDETVEGDGVVAVWTSGAAGDQNPISMARGEDFTMVDAMGKILGEESVRVASNITAVSPAANLWSSQRVITCPGRRAEQGPAPRADYKFNDADPVNIRLSLLMLNEVAFAGVSGEVLTPIYQRLKRESPFNDTIMVTNANGSSGYIPHDDGYNQISYEIVSTRLKPGCAEGGIVNGFLEMMGSR